MSRFVWDTEHGTWRENKWTRKLLGRENKSHHDLVIPVPKSSPATADILVRLSLLLLSECHESSEVMIRLGEVGGPALSLPQRIQVLAQVLVTVFPQHDFVLAKRPDQQLLLFQVMVVRVLMFRILPDPRSVLGTLRPLLMLLLLFVLAAAAAPLASFLLESARVFAVVVVVASERIRRRRRGRRERRRWRSGSLRGICYRRLS